MCGLICAMYGCSNYGLKNQSKSYFHFPGDLNRCKQWVQICCRTDLDDTMKNHGPEHMNKMYRFCSDHFSPTMLKDPNLTSQTSATMKWNRLLFSQITKYLKATGTTFQLSPQGKLRNVSTSSYIDFYGYVNQYHQLIERQLLCSFSQMQFGVPENMSIGIRRYAKGKDKRKSDKGKKKIEINEEQLSEIIKVDALKNQMQKALDNLKEDYIKNLSLRSTTGSIETLQVKFDGKEYTLQLLAQVVRKNPKTVVVNMAVFPQAIPAVLQAIQKSGMNLNPQQDGTTIYIPVPKVTKEHRENLAKNAKLLFVKCRDSIKDIQNKYIKTVKNNANISEDLSHEVQDQIISLGHQYVSAADKMLESKQAELIGKG